MDAIPEICAIIPARGGSKGLPRKNLRLMAGKPLVAHTILASRGSRYIRDCIVTTEDPEIREIGTAYGAEIIDRPAHLAGDLTTSQEVVRHVLEQLAAAGRRPKYFVLLQPTSPLRTARHIDACIEEFFRSGASCAISVCVSEHSPFKALVSEGGRLAPLFDEALLHQPRQTLPVTYRQNGAIYLMSSALFLEKNTFFVNPAMPFVMPVEASIDIDSPGDLEMAESGYVAWNGTFAHSIRRAGKPIDLPSLRRDTGWRLEMADRQRRTAASFRGHRRRLARCPVCSGSKFTTFVHVFEYEYAECGDCGHLFCTTPPASGEVSRLYDGTEPEGSIQDLIYLDEDLFRRRVSQIARPKVDFVGSVTGTPGLWADVGCGTGELLAAARDAGWKVRGYEADPAEVRFGRERGLDISEAFITEENAAACLAGAQVVSFLNVLEHIPDPPALLKAVAAAAEPDAWVVIEVPRHPSLSSFNNRAFPRLACRHVYAPDHLHVFSERSAERMLGSAGLTAVAVWTFGQDCYDLISCVASNANTEQDELHRRVIAISARMQAAVDTAGLSDTLFLVSRKASHA